MLGKKAGHLHPRKGNKMLPGAPPRIDLLQQVGVEGVGVGSKKNLY